MNSYYLLLSIALAAIISVTVWVDYYRKIDVFKPEKLVHLLAALSIGCATPFLSLFVYDIFHLIGFRENGKAFNDLVYAIFGIGLNEELCKIAGAIVAFKLLKKHINESVDYLIYAGMVALGFAMVENFFYIKRYGIDIVTNRSFYSVLEHIINTSIITYGYFRFKIFKKGNHWLNTFTGVAMAISSHGLFDYFILNPHFSHLSQFLVIAVYLVGINFWITMLNNTINFSYKFNYENIQYSNKLLWRLTIWYFFTMLIGLIYKVFQLDIYQALYSSMFHIVSDGFLFLIVILRASRFKLYKNYYQPVTIQLPFYITRQENEDFNLLGILPLKIRGENSFEYYLTQKMGKHVEVIPMNTKNSFLKKNIPAIVNNKHYLNNGVTVYELLLPPDEVCRKIFLKPKTWGKTKVYDSYPVNDVLTLKENIDRADDIKHFYFREWAYVKPKDEVSKVNY
jgi:RsiW-degrading membrane proteinase PrsW (M82 family)